MLGFAICIEGRDVACKAVLSLEPCCGMLGFAICIEGRVVACKAVLSAMYPFHNIKVYPLFWYWRSGTSVVPEKLIVTVHVV